MICAPKRYVIVHPEMGIYLGSAMGMGFWSKLDSLGEDAAVTFIAPSTAEEVMAAWDSKPSPVSFVAVDADIEDSGLHYASMVSCVKAGLPAWEP